MDKTTNKDGSGSFWKAFWKPVPLIFTATLILFVFSTFVWFVLLPMQDQPAQKENGSRYLLAISILFAIFFLSFLRVAIADPGKIPDWFNKDSPEARAIKSVEKKGDGSRRRFCNKECMSYKPDRTHHCRICKRCNLKMDHHCPWINNCVGQGNYKFFILFITYALVCTVFVFIVTLTTIPSFEVSNLTTAQFITILDCVITGALSLVLTAFVSFHYYLMANNYTTIEFCEKRGCLGKARKKHVNYFDLGAWRNIKTVFGSNILLWPFPIESSTTDGLQFETNDLFEP